MGIGHVVGDAGVGGCRGVILVRGGRRCRGWALRSGVCVRDVGCSWWVCGWWCGAAQCGQARTDRDDWCEFPEEASVPEGNPAGSVDLDRVLIELVDLNDGAGPVPSTWLWAHLVLYADMVSHAEGRKPSGVFLEVLGHYHVLFPEGLFLQEQRVTPVGVSVAPGGWG